MLFTLFYTLRMTHYKYRIAKIINSDILVKITSSFFTSLQKIVQWYVHSTNGTTNKSGDAYNMKWAYLLLLRVNLKLQSIII